jgi:hypothetical protein
MYDSLSLPVLIQCPHVGFGGRVPERTLRVVGRAALGMKSNFINDSTFSFPQIWVLFGGRLGWGQEL